MNRRLLFKNYIVDREFQYAYIARNIVLLLVVAVAVLTLIFAWNRYKFKEGFILRPPSGEQVIAWADKNNVKYDSVEFAYQYIVQAKLFTFFDLIWKPVTAIFVLNLLILAFSSLYFSYRIAGPVYRLKTTLQKIVNGEKTDAVTFRKDDPFHELSDLVNKALKLSPPQKPPEQN